MVFRHAVSSYCRAFTLAFCSSCSWKCAARNWRMTWLGWCTSPTPPVPHTLRQSCYPGQSDRSCRRFSSDRCWVVIVNACHPTVINPFPPHPHLLPSAPHWVNIHFFQHSMRLSMYYINVYIIIYVYGSVDFLIVPCLLWFKRMCLLGCYWDCWPVNCLHSSVLVYHFLRNSCQLFWGVLSIHVLPCGTTLHVDEGNLALGWYYV